MSTGRIRRIAALVTAVAAVAACGGGSDAIDGGAPEPDAAPIERSDRDYLLSRVVLPVSAQDVEDTSFVFPGDDRPKNQLGGLITVLLDLVEGVPVQADLDANFEAGVSLQLGRIHSGTPTSDDPMVRADFGDVLDADEPPDPTNNLSGVGEFRLEQPLGGFLDSASLSGGVVEGAGPDAQIVIGVPLLPGEPPARVPVAHPQARLAMTEDALAGELGGALTEADLHTRLFPPIAAILTRAIEMGTPQSATIQGLFDADADDIVTVQELMNNDTIASLTALDVDLDGDGVADHISVGIRIEWVRCQVVP